LLLNWREFHEIGDSMNNFFKLSVIAAAVALSGTATAGSFTGNGTTVTANENAVVLSAEGFLSGNKSAVQYFPTVSYKLGADYLVSDEITFTFANAYDANTVFPANITVGGANFQQIGSTATTVSYRVTSGTAVSGSLFTFTQNKSTVADLTDTAKSGIVVANTEVDADNAITVASLKSGVTPFDTETTVANASKFLMTATQFGTTAVATKYNAVIDGSTAGAAKIFTNGDLSDAASFTYTAPTAMPTQALLGQNIGLNDLTATADKVAQVATIQSNIVLANIADYTITSGVTGAVITTVAGTPTATDTAIVVTYPTGTTPVGDTVTITPKTGASAPTMIASTFNVTNVANSVALGAATQAMGNWAVASSDTVNVPYMPYGPGLSQVIYANNTTASDAEVSVVAYDQNGMSYDLGVVGVAGAKSVTKLATVIKNALATAGVTDGRLAMDVTFRGNTLTTGSIKLHTGYNANASDRGFVANTSNGAD
jgi:hypothetical protein